MKTKLLLAAMMLSMSLSLFAQSGTCGTNLTWNFSEGSGVLTITGTGDMTNYDMSKQTPTNPTPWNSYRDKIKSVILSNGVTSIGDYAFWFCNKMTSVTIPNSVTSIGSSAFYNCCSLTSITIPNSVTSIGNSAFSGCSFLTSIDIPNSVKTIGDRVFYDCHTLTSIEIPNSVTTIGEGAFKSCDGITTITIYAEAPPTAQTSSVRYQNGSYYLATTTAFDDLSVSDITLYVPTQSIPLYKYDPVWRQFNIQGINVTDQQYTVTWKNFDGSVLETDENIVYGTFPTYDGETPVKPADEQYTYTFAGWSPSVVTVTGDVTYTATYTATFKANTYIIHVNQDCTSYMEEQQ